MRLTSKILVGPAMLLAASGVTARPAPRTDFMPAGEVADAPFGFLDMCRRDRATCAAGGELTDPVPADACDVARCAADKELWRSGTAATTLSLHQAPARILPIVGRRDALLEQVRAVNTAVNRQVIQISDRSATGEDERWQRPDRVAHPVGDCEDISIEKRMRLIEGGFPAERLFFVVAFHPRFGLHTVLIARLPDGDRVLDSLASGVRRWRDVRYVWLRQQEPGRPMTWHRVGSPAPTERIAKVGIEGDFVS